MADESVGVGADPVPGWDDDPEIGESMEQDQAPGGGAAREPWWERLGIGIMVLLVLVGSALVPPSYAALAEAQIVRPIPVGRSPIGIGVNPATNRVYVGNNSDNNVTVIDSVTNTVVGSPISVGGSPVAIAVNPTTNRVYVVGFANNNVTVIDGASNVPIGSPIPVGRAPQGIAVNPTTNRVYATNSDDNTVSVIDGATNAVVGAPIPVGKRPLGIAVNPLTNRIYVANIQDSTVTAIDGITNTVTGQPIQVGAGPEGVAVLPTTNRVYVTNSSGASVSVIDGATNTVIGSPITIGEVPLGIAVNPVTGLIYVSDFSTAAVGVISDATRTVIGSAIPVGRGSVALATNPTTNRVYVASEIEGVDVLGIPLSTGPSATAPGATIQAAWDALFAPTGGDFAGLFEPSAPNTAPLARLFTNGTAAPGGPGFDDGSVDVPVPADLIGGHTYELRLVSGAPGATTLARVNVVSPTAANDSFTVARGAVLNVPAPGVLANDRAPGPFALQVALGMDAHHGVLILQRDGAINYTPDPAFAGTDSFTYHVFDGFGLPATASVTIAVTAVPAGAADAYTVAQGAVLTVPAPGVLANDTDADSPTLQALLATGPSHGTLQLQADGSFTFSPAPGFSGTDTFTYRASDGASQSPPVTVTIAVTVDACAPRPPVTVTTAASGGNLTAHVQASPRNTQQPNALRGLRFGALRNAKVTVGGQPVASGQTVTVPAGASTVDITIERATPGEPTTVPFTVTDSCGDWPTFVGGGPGAGF